jgi:hypothetical protein
MITQKLAKQKIPVTNLINNQQGMIEHFKREKSQQMKEEAQTPKNGQGTAEGIRRKFTKVESQDRSPLNYSSTQKFHRSRTGKMITPFCEVCNLKLQDILRTAREGKSSGPSLKRGDKLYQSFDFDEVE